MRKNAETAYREKKGNIFGFDDIFSQDFSKQIVAEIINQLMTKDYTMNQLIDAVNASKIIAKI